MSHSVGSDIDRLKRILRLCAMVAFTWLLYLENLEAAELIIRIDPPPGQGPVIAMLFNSNSTFVDLRDPLRVLTLSPGGAPPGRIEDLAAGEYALVVYQDENGNGRLDKNFIGIPSEPLGFSNRYRPQGPPTFSRAAFPLEANETKPIDVNLQPVLGKSGALALGAGVIAHTSPYREAKTWKVRPIPSISYIGDRLQIIGLTALYGVVNRKDYSLAATASYRFSAYREKDSPYLQGMGNRKDTLLGGVAMHAALPARLKLSAGYEHDLLDRTRGGTGRVGLEKSFQQGLLTISPKMSVNWISSALADHEYGVSAAQARPNRPAYHPGDAVSVKAGITLFREFYKEWQIILSSSVEFLPSNLTASPIVDQSQVVSSFLAVTRRF